MTEQICIKKIWHTRIHYFSGRTPIYPFIPNLITDGTYKNVLSFIFAVNLFLPYQFGRSFSGLTSKKKI